MAPLYERPWYDTTPYLHIHTHPQINATTCTTYPSRVNVTNVLFENFSGYTSGKYGRAVASLTCSANPDAVCENIVFRNFSVTSPCSSSGPGAKPAVIICDNIRGGVGAETGCVSSTNPLKIVCTGVGVSTGKVVGPEELMIIYIICKKL